MSADQVIAGRYRLAERLGGGGMGVVWLAHDERLRRTVAVKQVILPPSLDEERLAEVRRRTVREGRIAAKLHHPQLITVYDVLEDEGRPYLVMEYLPSTNLSKQLAEQGALPPAEVARIGSQAAAALAAAHAAGVVHRDVKPGNILVGDNGTVKITDFGISRVVEDVTGTVTGTFVGTPAYLAPEVARGKDVTFASDVYSLGATLYKAVEGVSPAGSSDNPMLMLHRIASGTVNPPKQAGPLAEILLRMLHADPAARPTMNEAKAALERIASSGETVTAPAPPEPVPTPAPASPPTNTPAGTPAGTPARRRRSVAILAAVCVLVAAVTTLLVLNLTGDKGTPGSASPGGGSPGSATESASRPPATPTTEPTDTTKPTNPPSSTTAPSSTPQAPGSPADAVTSYYALMPGGLEVGWTRLTPRFQQTTAGGLEGYRSFWNSVSSVSTADVSPQDSIVEVTVSYSFKDGRHIRERHRYQLIEQNGGWLIDRVSVLSSTSNP